jgi:hypothetical protein
MRFRVLVPVCIHNVYTHTCIYTYKHVHIHTRNETALGMGIYVFIYTYMCICVYTYICMHIYTPARVTALGMGMEEDEGVEHAVGGEHLAHPLACR